MSEREQMWEVPAVRVGGESKGGDRESLFKRLLRKIFPDQRKQERIATPPAVGYLGTVNGSRPFEVGDVSLGGFRLVTAERWIPGTEMPVTLQRTSGEPEQHGDHFTIQATVVRWAEDGVAFSVVLSEEESSAVFDNPLHVWWANKEQMQQFLERLRNADGKQPAERDLQTRREQVGPLSGSFSPVLTHGAGD